ncbi:MAG: hypothetical protein IJK40_02590, partial [Clostridia bacterium]|nr:hypothetical protein [Clostridia bacterium]
MNDDVIYDAFSGVDEEYLSAADDTDAIRLSFQRDRTRTVKIIGTVCACVCFVLAAVWTGAQRLPGKTPSALPDETVPADPPPVQTEPAGSEPGSVPPETASAAPPVQTTDTPSVGGGEKPVQATEAPFSEAPASDDGSVIWADGDTSAVGSAIVGWNGKQIDYALWSVLQEGTGDRTLAITAS